MQTTSVDQPRTCSNCGEPLDRHFDAAGIGIGCPDDQVAVARIRERERERIFVLELGDLIARHHHGCGLAELSPESAGRIRAASARAVRVTDTRHTTRRDVAIRKAASGRLIGDATDRQVRHVAALIDAYERHLSGGIE